MMTYSSYTAINEAFTAAEEEFPSQIDLIEKEVYSMMGSNFTALRLLAVNNAVQEYLVAAPENRSPNMKKES